MTSETVPSPGVFGTIWQRRWWIVVPAVVSAAATWSVASLTPARYESAATVLVIPQQVPADYVRPTVTQTLQDRLASIQTQILSRTRLERIIQDYDLYHDRRAHDLMEDIVESMRRSISVTAGSGEGSFRVKFVADSPRTAQKVTEKLASLMVDESLKDREVLAQGTDQFLESATEDAKKRLDDYEKGLAKYKAEHAGVVPGSMAIEGKVLEDTYRALLEKREDSRLAANLERRQVGEQFRIVDSARVPEKPIGPSRGFLSAMAAMGGTLVGFVVVGLIGRRRAS